MDTIKNQHTIVKTTMLSLFANRVNRVSKGAWDPNKFKIDGGHQPPPETVEPSTPFESATQNEQFEPVMQQPEAMRFHANTMYPMYPTYPAYMQTHNMHPQTMHLYPPSPYSPQAYQALDEVGPVMTQYLQPSRQTQNNFRQVIKPLETNNLAVNPVENLESSYGVKTAPSAPQQLKEEWSNKYCEDSVPSKQLTKRTIASYELMGRNEAQRRSRPMGEGVPNIGPAVPIAAVNEYNYGKGNLSMTEVSYDLYHQQFDTLGATPAVYTGIYTDPLTGIQYDTFESSMPPPDGDWYDMSYSSGKNRKMDMLQGGWSNNTPRPPRREILEGDWNQGFDRTVNTFGGAGSASEYLRCRNLDNGERSTRFNLNDFTPDNEAPELTGVPANVDGIYGNQKIRFLPRLPGTNRGTKEEASLRGGVQTEGYHENHVAREYTHFPECLPPLEYVGPVDGSFGAYGDMVHSDYETPNRLSGMNVNDHLMQHGVGYVDTVGELVRSDHEAPNRLSGMNVNDHLMQHGVGLVDTVGEQVRSDYEQSNKFTGLEVNEHLGKHGIGFVDTVGELVRSDYEQSNKFTGLDVNEHMGKHGIGFVDTTGELVRSDYEQSNKFTGLDVNENLGKHGIGFVDTNGNQVRSDYEQSNKFTGLDVNENMGKHGIGFVDTVGQQSRSDYEQSNKFTGMDVNDHLGKHGAHGNNAVAGKTRAAYTRSNRIALLKSMHGAIQTTTNGHTVRSATTRFNSNKGQVNTVMKPGGMMQTGSSTDSSIGRAPSNWTYYRTPNTHKQSLQRLGAVTKAVENDSPIVGQFPVKFEMEQSRMGGASFEIGNPSDVSYALNIRGEEQCKTY